MIRFVVSEIAEITYLWGEKIKNRPVNIGLCTSITKSRENWYPDNVGKPSMIFKGCNAQWVFDNEQDRDKEYERILSLFP